MHSSSSAANVDELMVVDEPALSVVEVPLGENWDP